MPDADALVQIAELYEVSVGRLLGAPEETPDEKNTAPDPHEIAEQLSRINEQLVIRNRRSARILKVIGAVLLVYLICLLLSLSAFSLFRVEDAPVIETHTELTEFEED